MRKISKNDPENRPLNLATYIDHTNLKPEATAYQIELLCDEALQYNFYSVCVNPYWVSLASKRLKSSPIKICTVIGFPLGANLTSTKIVEAQQTLDLGADEFDMVMNIGKAKESDWNFISDEVEQIVEIVQGKCVKVIIETCLLTKEEIYAACKTCEKTGAFFVKTSTGFSKEGATIENIMMMKNVISTSMGIKASGGIKNKETAIAMIEAGATRIGTSASVAIVS